MKTSILNNSIFTAILIITFSFNSNAQMSAGMAAISIANNETVKSNFNNTSSIKLATSFVTDEVNIVLPVNSIISKTIITDAAGRTVSNTKANHNAADMATVNVSDLTAGFYKINVVISNGQSINMKFTKN